MEPLRLRGARLSGLPGLAWAPARAAARAWLAAAVAALGGSGLVAGLVVAARTPGVGESTALAEAFPRALVAHVTLGVLAWLAAMGAALWTLAGRPGYGAAGRAGEVWVQLAPVAFWVGLALVCLAALGDGGEALLLDYVPLLTAPGFVAGLALMALGAGLAAARLLLRAPARTEAGPALAAAALGLLTALAVAALGLAVTPAAWEAGPGMLARLVWAPGHLMQGAWALLTLGVWILLARVAGLHVPPASARAGLALGLGALAAAMLAETLQPTALVGRLATQSTLMALAGLAPLPLALALAPGLARARRLSPPAQVAGAGLRAALLLYGAGGLLALAIAGADTRVPAHYHASIAGVGLGLMAMTWLLLPRLGARAVPAVWARWQLRLYGAGQLLHALGLAWAGGYGAARKQALAAGGALGPAEHLALAVMAAGAALAALAGAAFVLRVALALARPSAPAREAADEAEDAQRQHQDDGEEGELAMGQACAPARLDP